MQVLDKNQKLKIPTENADYFTVFNRIRGNNNSRIAFIIFLNNNLLPLICLKTVKLDRVIAHAFI